MFLIPGVPTDLVTVLAVQSGQAAGLMAFGDGVCQLIEGCSGAPPGRLSCPAGETVSDAEEPPAGAGSPAAEAGGCCPRFSCRRWGRMITLNVVFQGASQYYFYQLLLVLFPGLSWPAVIKRMVADQFVYNPASNAAIMSSVAIDQSAAEATRKLRADFLTAMIPAWVLWVPGDLINFKCVPPAGQVAFYNAVNSIYLIYFSWVTNNVTGLEAGGRDAPAEDEEDPPPPQQPSGGSSAGCAVM
eukprot:TRINITY_DN17874_c0_g1_i3.p1 TRINITY_DN17874_c0_g1~~TRINITY_DN17874_c0_g1_i3.p1  ORF type:complete len:272 (+),score=73.95 TRINITY_DN17874_c0_g1_i3:90-818(+)